MTDNADQGSLSFDNDAFNRVMIEVSMVLKGGRKITARICEDCWWSILSDDSKSKDRKESEILELLLDGIELDEDLWS